MIAWFLDVLGQMVLTHILTLIGKGLEKLKNISEEELSQMFKEQSKKRELSRKVVKQFRKNVKIQKRKKARKNLKNRK